MLAADRPRCSRRELANSDLGEPFSVSALRFQHFGLHARSSLDASAFELGSLDGRRSRLSLQALARLTRFALGGLGGEPGTLGVLAFEERAALRQLAAFGQRTLV